MLGLAFNGVSKYGLFFKKEKKQKGCRGMMSFLSFFIIE